MRHVMGEGDETPHSCLCSRLRQPRLLEAAAVPRVHLSVTGYANPAYSSGPAGASFFVIRNKDADNSLMDQEVPANWKRQ